MPSNTPWCPRCGDWRGYNASICKGCMKVEEMLLQLPGTTTDPKTKLTVPTPEATPDMKKVLTTTRLQMTGQRFAFVSERRTEREAYTQGLEEFVDQNVDELKSIAYRWGQMRVIAKQFKFSHMYAQEMMEAMELALSELGGVSLELSKYVNNPAIHDERMARIGQWMEVLQKFRAPDAVEVVEEQPEQEGDDDGDDDAGDR